jgi:hypothetical protein
MTNIPAAATRAHIDFFAAPGALHERTSVVEMPPSGPTLSGVFTVADLPGAWRATDLVWIEGATGYSALIRSRHYPTWPASHEFSADALAYVSVNPVDTSDPERPTVTWSASSAAHGDVAEVGMSWSGATSGVLYRVRMPPGAVTSFRVPEFPDELSSYAPAPTSTFGPASAKYRDYASRDGYAAVLEMTGQESAAADVVTSLGVHD